ncbi:MAG: glycoside hydrolase family 57 protein [Desulfovibrio sp.]|nr:glycoside hydrolase family 57 protein [Desulfovibrio sp.]
MAAICLAFAIHEPYSLRRYTVFDINENSVYQDDDRSCSQAMYYAQNCYLPMMEILYRHIKRFRDRFSFAVSVSGSALDLFEQYTPEVIDSLKRLAETGNVEFVSEAGPHTLAQLYSTEEFVHQVREHNRRLRRIFGRVATCFRNTELLFNNDLAHTIAQLGFKTVLTEGSPDILGWRSPNYLYNSSIEPQLHLLLRNPSLSQDLSGRFSDTTWNEWPLTAEKFASWCHRLGEEAETVNLFLDFHAFGLRNSRESGIFDFAEHLPDAILASNSLSFMTPKQIIKKYSPKDALASPHSISWNDEGCDIRGWLGNEMQRDAIQSLYSLTLRIRRIGDGDLIHDFERLQTSDFFHYMSTRWFSESQPDRPNPFLSPYDAYISFMNILTDLTQRVSVLEEEKGRKKRAAAKGNGMEESNEKRSQISAKTASMNGSGGNAEASVRGRRAVRKIIGTSSKGATSTVKAAAEPSAERRKRTRVETGSSGKKSEN